MSRPEEAHGSSSQQRSSTLSSLSLLSTASPQGVADFDFHLSLPGASGFHGAHVLINHERAQRGLPVLNRSKFLDRLCQPHARHMANERKVSHSAQTCQQIQQVLNSDHAGENVQRGDSVERMHTQAMKPGTDSFRNILARSFTEFGLATAMGEDGKLYMVVLFRGEERQLKTEQVCI